MWGRWVAPKNQCRDQVSSGWLGVSIAGPKIERPKQHMHQRWTDADVQPQIMMPVEPSRKCSQSATLYALAFWNGLRDGTGILVDFDAQPTYTTLPSFFAPSSSSSSCFCTPLILVVMFCAVHFVTSLLVLTNPILARMI